MQPPVTPLQTPRHDREDDYRLRPFAEPKSWMADESHDSPAAHRAATRIYTHNAEHFGRREPAVETREEEVEPALSPPPQWMMMIAGAAVAALMGALLGGFMHI